MAPERREIAMMNLIRRIASRLSHNDPQHDRSDRPLRGALVCKLETDLAYFDNITRVLGGLPR
jgi:hypothetical protein